jgi:hypothetical protein
MSEEFPVENDLGQGYALSIFAFKYAIKKDQGYKKGLVLK